MAEFSSSVHAAAGLRVLFGSPLPFVIRPSLLRANVLDKRLDNKKRKKRKHGSIVILVAREPHAIAGPGPARPAWRLCCAVPEPVPVAICL